ncbi:unnamed protein product [Lota lota]
MAMSGPLQWILDCLEVCVLCSPAGYPALELWRLVDSGAGEPSCHPQCLLAGVRSSNTHQWLTHYKAGDGVCAVSRALSSSALPIKFLNLRPAASDVPPQIQAASRRKGCPPRLLARHVSRAPQQLEL